MKRFLFLSPLLLAVAFACTSQVDKDLQTKMAQFQDFDFAAVENLCQSPQELDYLKFLYAYMPLSDVADYAPALFVDVTRLSLEAREALPWGATVPEQLFKHFVLPLRVNNEDLDRAREVFYQELKPRVEGLSMYDAVLEVNHWCHEKVNYKPSDGRTSAPLATMKTANGRCGEESTFTVTALRSVGIPARQVYTPRWAHTDNNHAWVEAWVDGKWYYLGACEPEARLDIGWFSDPVRRAMLLHTRAFGPYDGPEDAINRTHCYTEINVTSNYVDIAPVDVVIKDPQGRPVEGARVDFTIYNYAEFYPAIRQTSDAKGHAHATFGLGDVLVFAQKDERFGYIKVSVQPGLGLLDLVLDRSLGEPFEDALDIVPPAESSAGIVLTEEEVAENQRRFAQEDSIRNAYIATWATPALAESLSAELRAKVPTPCLNLGLADLDPANLFRYLKAACGNWEEILSFLRLAPAERVGTALRLLDQVALKDLRDTPAPVLLDHLNHFALTEDPLYLNYVLNPRIALELLSPWRGFFQAQIPEDQRNPQALLALAAAVKDGNAFNPQRIPMRPMGVYQQQVADKRSRDVFFIALCRSCNIPARFEEVSGKLQYYQETWVDVEGPTAQAPTGELKIHYTGQSQIKDPGFDTHFSISALSPQGRNVLNFRNREGDEGTVSWASLFQDGTVPTDAGYYLLTSGVRMASGKVLANLAGFNVVENQVNEANLVLREDKTEFQVIGNMDPEVLVDLLLPTADGKGTQVRNQSILSHTGRGYFVLAFLKPGHEPSNHALLSLCSQSWKRPVILFYENEKQVAAVNAQGMPALPQNLVLGLDGGNALQTQLRAGMDKAHFNYPLVLIADTFGRIVFWSEGYRIGVAEQVSKFL